MPTNFLQGLFIHYCSPLDGNMVGRLKRVWNLGSTAFLFQPSPFRLERNAVISFKGDSNGCSRLPGLIDSSPLFVLPPSFTLILQTVSFLIWVISSVHCIHRTECGLCVSTVLTLSMSRFMWVSFSEVDLNLPTHKFLALLCLLFFY